MKIFTICLLSFSLISYIYPQQSPKPQKIAQTKNILVAYYNDSLTGHRALFVSDLRLGVEIDVARFMITFMPQNETLVQEQKCPGPDQNDNCLKPCKIICPNRSALKFCSFAVDKIEVSEEGKVFKTPCNQGGAVINRITVWLKWRIKNKS